MITYIKKLPLARKICTSLHDDKDHGMFAYIDETGNTGENLFDPQQPLFITGALMTRVDFDQDFGPSVRAVCEKIQVEEIHAQKLGVGRLDEIAIDILKILKKSDAHFSLSRIEKMYLVATKLVDVIFDSGENLAVPWSVYNIRQLRMLLVFKVSALLDNELVELFWASLMESNQDNAYKMFEKVCSILRGRASQLPDARSREIIEDATTWAIENSSEIHLHSGGKLSRYGHLPNMVAFTNLLRGIEEQSNKWRCSVDTIKHDRQNQFETSLARWHELVATAPDDVINLPGEEGVKLQKVYGSKFEISSAANSPGIQMIDVILWCFKRTLDEKALSKNLEKLMKFVYTRAYQHDFSFKGVGPAVAKELSDIYDTPIDEATLAKGRELVEYGEVRRQKGLAEYAKKKRN